ncbi:50S ribosome-binding GTPase [Candidatus Woesearchaeota archaeon]|nr:50S ribosome-binding GTPase [Candidatus Woesearchaeota archaeon]
MNFQHIPTVEKADFQLDVAIKKAHRQAEKLRQQLPAHNKFRKSQQIEKIKVEILCAALIERLEKIVETFPRVDEMPPFYNELIKITIDIDQYKHSLGAIAWVVKQIQHLRKKILLGMKNPKDALTLNVLRKSCYGRCASFVKQIGKDLIYLEGCRKIIREYPVIKTSLKTVVIAGFPNVGKTTLLYKLTGSKPEIDEYAFTTKGINVSYLTKPGEGRKKERLVQLLDTPGTLNRFNKMNNIEKQAYLAQQLLADLIIYVFDVTEPYPLDQQEKLFDVVKNFGKEVLVYLSKTDLLDTDQIRHFKHEHLSVEQLKEKMLSLL